jgi:SAM-dependent methyltransferase
VTNPKDIVRRGYDHISYQYRDDVGNGPAHDQLGQYEGRPDYEAWLAELMPLVHDGDPVPDLSPVQIERARRPVPAARFDCADMATVDFPPQSFAAVVSFYAIIHVPIEEQPAIFRNIYRWLRPGGHLMATLGSGTYIAWLEETGFEVLWTRFIPEGTGGHTLILAKRLP